MQSASLELAPAGLTPWARARSAVPAATLWSAAIVFLLVLVVSRSTVAASWVVMGIETAPLVALAGAALMAVLAVTPLPWWLCLGLGMAAGPVVAGFDAAPAFRAFHADDPTGLALVQVWLGRMQDGTAFADNAFVLFVIAWLMWIAGAWLAWCVLRWRQPLIGLIPGAAAFATNVLNFPRDQNGFTLAFLVLTFALLLWTNYTGSVAKAVRARVKLTGDARWDFWESGLVATAILIVAGIMLPPLSTVDRTATTTSSIFSTWAQLQQALNHPSDSSLTGPGNGAGTTGFNTDVRLAGQLKKSTALVFTYAVSGTYIGPRYFRGVNVTQQVNGEWRYDPSVALKQPVARGESPPYAESYLDETFATFSVTMAAPPPGNGDLLFYPGEMVKADRDTLASQVVPQGFQTPESSSLLTIDRLSTRTPPTSKGGYTITSEFPNAFEADLRGAGTDYSGWLEPYMTVPPSGYRDPAVLKMELDLAERITAGKTNVYDMATAIQNYLRENYRYALNPGNPPPGTDRIDYFLNTSKTGYCEYFATAMGDMLRLLGIPTRLVNGFGAGTFHSEQNRNVVTASDAHTWVEVYFPGYGWIPFEPTPDPNYSPITRGHSDTTNICINDALCAGNTTGSTGTGNPRTNPEGGRPGGNQGDATGAGPTGGGFKFGVPDAGTLTKVIAVLLALILLIAAFVSRYLRPRTVMGVWRRTLVLARLAGASVMPGETPLELGRRLSRLFPEVEAPAKALAGGFAVAAYAPPDSASETRSGVMEAWAQLRPLMLRRVARRLRPART